MLHSVCADSAKIDNGYNIFSTLVLTLLTIFSTYPLQYLIDNPGLTALRIRFSMVHLVLTE
jgi:hypothetical protein